MVSKLWTMRQGGMTRVNLLKETLGDGESIVDKDPVKSGEGQDCSDGDVQRFKAGSCADWGS